MTNINDLPYRLGVGVVLTNANKKVFVGQRIDNRFDAWQMPQGGIDKGETDDQALMRELLEEVGTNNISIISKTHNLISYDLPKNIIENIWQGRYRGQLQRWYLVKLLGNDSEININTPEPEFKEWKWVDFEETINLIVPFKRDLYKKIIDEFKFYFTD